MSVMQPLKARVQNGRLKLDEPTDLPEGMEVPLEISDSWDDLDDEERAALHREIAASIAERKAGAPTYSIEEVLAELGPRR
jgi:predicted DNA-binding antitoxin AbrB/MazE fold protein